VTRGDKQPCVFFGWHSTFSKPTANGGAEDTNLVFLLECHNE